MIAAIRVCETSCVSSEGGSRFCCLTLGGGKSLQRGLPSAARVKPCPAASPPWTVEQIPGGYKVKDANGQALTYVYARETQADIANVLTMDEARRARPISRSSAALCVASH